MFLKIKNIFLELFTNPVVINAFLFYKNGKLRHRNWGDDINYYFFKKLFRKNIVSYDHSTLSHRLNKSNYLMIGSSITLLCNEKSIIWGSGVIDPEQDMPAPPQSVLAVRGPLTRKYLLDRGIPCPAVYGDPAMLLPLMYRPRVAKKYKLGIVPHYSDYHSSLLNRVRNRKDVVMIKMEDYVQWTDVIDQINMCESIVSSSLHGLIVAEAYGVPARWISVENKLLGCNFKFYDFYASIGQAYMAPLQIDENTTVDLLCKEAMMRTKGALDLKPLINACPFKTYFNFSYTEETIK